MRISSLSSAIAPYSGSADALNAEPGSPTSFLTGAGARMTTPSSIGVIFDMDGVLIDSASAHFRSWQLLAREHGTTVAQEQFTATFGRQNRDIIPLLFEDVTPDRLRLLADRKEAIYRDLIREDPPIVDGAAALIRDLHAIGVRLAVGSSGPRANIDLVLRALGATDRIPVVVSGDDVTRGKPDPQVFTLSATRLGIPANRCVVVEDAPVGIEAARAAGTRTVAVSIYHPARTFTGVDCVVDRLADLTADRLVSLVAAR